MSKNLLKPYLFFILLTEAVGIIAGLLTKGGLSSFDNIIKPALNPPSFIFPIVWTILFALMGYGAARIWLAENSEYQSKSLILFFTQLIVNFFWSFFFFNLNWYAFSFLWLIFLWILVLLMILNYKKVDKIAAYTQIPYLLWITFAGYLNFAIWMLNK